jgi:hypothetical protein
VFIYEATEPFAFFLQAFTLFLSVPAMLRFFFVVISLAPFRKLEKTIILLWRFTTNDSFFFSACPHPMVHVRGRL